MDPTPERFRRLARSAAYRWRSLLLEGSWGPHVTQSPALAVDNRMSDAIRLRVERPDRIRVETRDGVVLQELRQGGLGSGAVLTSDGRSVPRVPPPPPVPELDEDGLVVSGRQPWNDGPDVPMWQDYRFVAALDPYELADGVDVLELATVAHGGRPAWEALLRPTAGYEPRCSCCPLMRTRETDLMEGLEPRPGYAEAHRVRLDVGTGVCVSAREIGGPGDGTGHDLVLVEVDP